MELCKDVCFKKNLKKLCSPGTDRRAVLYYKYSVLLSLEGPA
jgi:hypothetical protein